MTFSQSNKKNNNFGIKELMTFSHPNKMNIQFNKERDGLGKSISSLLNNIKFMARNGGPSPKYFQEGAQIWWKKDTNQRILLSQLFFLNNQLYVMN